MSKDAPTQPLRDEHCALLPELAALRAAADAVGTAAESQHLQRAHRLVLRHLVPHMDAEEAVLYPAINHVAGADVTASLRRDHDEIRRRAAALEAPAPEPNDRRGNRLRAALYGLDAVIQLHLDKEEELYYPILDRHLDDEAAVKLVVAMHEVERDLRGHRGVGP